ncbi:extracellular solute-binding protein [Catenulispora sp. NL8]|uniref:Extracellular solute-binding protein n=1 Tax=Catenulispora pinistramenti TaxID=2705254 RepID=A0ABS5KY50_9ACTN|nr:extracellular solute-binding protein [Catenulispora pinistramenti]MBS2550930.1 extracellular solute-binding protein [Catenulispora pinistramenti]
MKVPETTRLRGIRTGAVLAAAALALAACGNNGGGGASAAGGKITLRITWWGNPTRAKATQDAIALFQKAHPNISVQTQPGAYTGYYDKLNTQVTAGDAPDIFQVDTVAKYADKNALVDLSTQSPVLNTAKIDQSYLAQGSVNGKLYEVPAGSNLFALTFSGDLVAKAGLTSPTAGLSWQQYATLAKQISAKKLSAAGGGQVYGAADDSYNTQAFEIWARQQGGNLYSADGKSLGFSKQTLVDWWNYWAAMRADGAVPPATTTEPGVTGDVTKAPIAKGQVAMDLYGTSTTLPGTGWQYVGLPGESGHPGAYLKRSVNWGIYAKSKHPTEAAELIDFLVNSPEAGAAQGLTRGGPVNSDVLTALTPTLTGNDKAVATYGQYVAQAGNNSAPPPAAPAAQQQIETDLYVRMAENVWFGKSSVDAAAQSFMDQADKLLAQGS